MKLAKIQAASGVLFALFLALHLGTTASASSGIAAYDGTLATLRHIYRPNLFVEILLIALPATLHMSCALISRWRRRSAPAGPWRLRAHRWAGWLLLLIFAGHAFATRVLPALGTGSADFSYLAYSVLAWPAFIKPYYVIFGVAGAIHLSVGLPLAAKILMPSKFSTKSVVRVGWVVAAVMACAVLAGVFSIYRHAPEASRARFAEYRELYRKYLPVMPSVE